MSIRHTEWSEELLPSVCIKRVDSSLRSEWQIALIVSSYLLLITY